MFIFIYVLMMVENNKTPILNEVSDRISIVESNNNPRAIGDTVYIDNYSVGLCQIRIKTAKEIINKMIKSKIIKAYLKYKIKKMGVHGVLLSPFINKYLCIRYLIWLSKIHKNNIKETIISYNTGSNASESVRNGSGLIYYNKVMSCKNKKQ